MTVLVKSPQRAKNVMGLFFFFLSPVLFSGLFPVLDMLSTGQQVKMVAHNIRSYWSNLAFLYLSSLLLDGQFS